MKIIYLSGKDRSLQTIVDDEDYQKYGSSKWLLAGKGYVSRVIYTGKKGKKRESRKTLYLHRLIMDCPTGMYVDHINNNRLDNRKENLRICTNTQNNVRKSQVDPNKKLPYIGVYKYKQDFSYRFQIKYGDIFIHGRGYKTAEDAEKHYQTIHKMLYKEFSSY